MSTIKVDNIEDKSDLGLKVQGTEPIGTDVNVYFSGSIGSKNSATRGTAIFGGDLVASGSAYLGINKSNIPIDFSAVKFYVTGTAATFTPALSLASNYVSLIGGDLVVSGVIRGGLASSGGGETNYDLVLYGDSNTQYGRSHNFVGQNYTLTSAPPGDMTFFISGNMGSKDTSNPMNAGTAVVSGDMVVSGAFYAKQQQVYSFGALVDSTSLEYVDFYDSQGADSSFSQESKQMTAPAAGQIKLITLQQSAAPGGTTNINILTSTPPTLASAGSSQPLIAQPGPGADQLYKAVPSAVAGAIAAGDSWALTIQNTTGAPQKVNISLIIEWDLRDIPSAT